MISVGSFITQYEVPIRFGFFLRSLRHYGGVGDTVSPAVTTHVKGYTLGQQFRDSDLQRIAPASNLPNCDCRPCTGREAEGLGFVESFPVVGYYHDDPYHDGAGSDHLFGARAVPRGAQSVAIS